LRVQSPCVDQFRDAFDHQSSHPNDVCSYCHDYDVNSCPYYDVFDEAHARLNAMIETMNERHEHFINETREFSLLRGTDPRLEPSRHDDRESSLPLGSNVADDTPSTDLQEEFDPPLTFWPLFAPSFCSTPIATSVRDLTLLASPLPLA